MATWKKIVSVDSESSTAGNSFVTINADESIDVVRINGLDAITPDASSTISTTVADNPTNYLFVVDEADQNAHKKISFSDIAGAVSESLVLSQGNILAGNSSGVATATDTAYIDIANGRVGIGTATPASPLHIYSDDSTTGTSAGLTIEQDGTGDPVLQFLTTGSRRFVMGIDNSDSDKFKIAITSDLSSDAALSIDGDSVVNFHQGITTNSDANVSYGNITTSQNGTVVRGGFMNPASEANMVHLPHIVNDLAGFQKWGTITTSGLYKTRSGSSGSYTYSNEVAASDFSDGKAFDGYSSHAGSWYSDNGADGTTVTPGTIELSWDYELTYSAWVGIVFGANSFTATHVKIEAYRGGAWQELCDITDNTDQVVLRQIGSNSGTGSATTKIRYTLGGSVNNSYFRIHTLYAANYRAGDNRLSSSYPSIDHVRGVHYLEKYKNNYVHGGIYPADTTTYDIGNSTYKWNGLYANTVQSTNIINTGGITSNVLTVDQGSGSGGTGISLDSTGANLPFLRWHDGSTQIAGMRATSSGNFVIQTNGFNDRLAIDSSGNVGIGTTTPISSLHVAGAGYFSGGTLDTGVGLDQTYNYVGLIIDEEDFIYTKDGGSLRKLIGKASDVIQIGQTNTSLIDGISLQPGTTDGYVSIYDNTTEYARFQSGKLGIGTTTPSEELHVVGQIKVDDGANPYTLPAADGSANYVLQTNGSGVVSWAQIDYTTDIANTPSIPVSGVDFDPTGTDNSTNVSINANANEVLRMAPGQVLGAEDAGVDKLVFWDESASKLTYAAIGDNLTMTGATLSASVSSISQSFSAPTNAGEFQDGARLIVDAYGTSPSATAGNLVNLAATNVSNVGAQSAATGATGMLLIVTDAGSGDELLIEGVVKLSTTTTTALLPTNAKKGAPVYMSTTEGAVTTTAPGTAGDFVRVVGYVVDATNRTIYFKPDNTWLEL